MEVNSSDRTCAWALKHELEREYHDAEWGVPVWRDYDVLQSYPNEHS